MSPTQKPDWSPNTFPKQDSIRWAIHPDNPRRTPHLCVSGPRKSSKTTGCLHALVEHAWEVDRALIAVISPTVTAATDGGCWQSLCEEIIPNWIAGDFGLEWVRKPYQESVSKRFKCSIKNKHGTVSVFQLESFREGATEVDIATRFKGKKFSAVYFSEAGTWVANRKAYDIVSECLRLKEFWLKNQLTMILDTNPEPPGMDHWIPQIFYTFRVADERVLMDMIKDKPVTLEEMVNSQKRLGLIEVFVSDNLALTDEDHSELRSKYCHNQDLFDRYYLGKWTSASGSGLFHDVFRPIIHVVGELETPINKDPLMLVPSENCFELFTGWDLGTVNHAATILERYYWPDSKGVQVPHFNMIDELVYIQSDVNISEFTEAFLLKMDFWEEYLGKKLHWTHYSDRSSFDYRDSMSERRQHVEVALVSKNRIRLVAVDKFAGSVRQRVDIMRKLLFQDRVFISKLKCPSLNASLQSLRPGKNTPIEKQSEHRHVFDAATYPLQALCVEEIFRSQKAMFSQPESSNHISVAL